MTKIALTAAAILVATGSAFAGSDDYGNHGERNDRLPAVSQSVAIDHALTGSIWKSEKAQSNIGANVSSQSNRDLWGN